MSEARRGPSRAVLLAVPAVLFATVFAGARMLGGGSSGNPFADRAPFASPETAVSGAAQSASGDDQRILQRLADVPQGTWLTPESYPVDRVGAVVAKVAAAAAEADRTPVFVVYGITDRDCSGGESSGGLPADQYPRWVGAIAATTGPDAAVVLEPDALATAAECGQGAERMQLLRGAVDQLTGGGSTVYVDAGHASWTDPQEMARLLTEAGVEEARGFSTNVAGYEGAADERAYAEAISKALGGARYVIDTSRNGAGSNGEWCNPQGRALGREPGVVDDGALDAYLWVKPPGESDGTCGGGPPAGQIWPERALSLARAAGW